MSDLVVNLNELGNWRLVYMREHIGDPRARRIRAPMIDPIELPTMIESQILAVSATYIQASPTWNTAGWFYQEQRVPLDDAPMFPGVQGTGFTTLDSAKRQVELNSMQLLQFPRYGTEQIYRFEPARWMPKIRLGVWEYTGPVVNRIIENLETVKVDLVRIETKINGLL